MLWEVSRGPERLRSELRLGSGRLGPAIKGSKLFHFHNPYRLVRLGTVLPRALPIHGTLLLFTQKLAWSEGIVQPCAVCGG